MKFLGANWRTSVSGYTESICVIVIAVCMLPPEVMGKPRVWIPAVILIVAKTIKDSVTKDKNVVGGNVQQDVNGSVVSAEKSSLVHATQNATA